MPHLRAEYQMTRKQKFIPWGKDPKRFRNMFKMWVRRKIHRKIKPWILIEYGTDCDGMRWSRESFHWRKKNAKRWFHETVESADGPTSSVIYLRYSNQGKEAKRNIQQWDDDRDRYAEEMGY